MATLVLGDSDGDVTESLRKLAGDRREFVRVDDVDAPKVFRNWRISTGNPNGDPAEFEAAQARVNDMMGTTGEVPARAGQPSPTGNDGDLQMEPPAKPRMQLGAVTRWQPADENPREERE